MIVNEHQNTDSALAIMIYFVYIILYLTERADFYLVTY